MYQFLIYLALFLRTYDAQACLLYLLSIGTCMQELLFSLSTSSTYCRLPSPLSTGSRLWACRCLCQIPLARAEWWTRPEQGVGADSLIHRWPSPCCISLFYLASLPCTWAMIYSSVYMFPLYPVGYGPIFCSDSPILFLQHVLLIVYCESG